MSEATLSKLITVQQLSEKLGVQKWTVRAMTRRGLPFIKLGEKFFFREADVDAWLAEQVTKNGAKPRDRRNAVCGRRFGERLTAKLSKHAPIVCDRGRLSLCAKCHVVRPLAFGFFALLRQSSAPYPIGSWHRD